MENPFRHAIATDPWTEAEVDVPDIGRGAFELCIRALDQVVSERRSSSVLLFGEAGTGKTHLLGRLYRHIRSSPGSALFVSIRLQSSPHRIWRHIRRCFVESLLRPVKQGAPQLDWVTKVRLHQMAKKKEISSRELRGLVERLGEEKRLSPNLCLVLEHLLRGRFRRDAAAWLMGRSLPESSLKRLDLVQEEEEEPGEAEFLAREVVEELLRLFAPIPVLFCFDQVEAIQRYPRDKEGLFALGQVVQHLHDQCTNVLLVSCVQAYFLETLEDAVMKPNYDRLSVYKSSLNPLDQDQAFELARMRLNSGALSPEVQQRFTALLEDKLRAYMTESGKTVREVLQFCAELFETWAGGARAERRPFPDEKSTDKFLAGEWGRRKESALQTLTPEDTDDLVHGALPLLAHVFDQAWREEDAARHRDIDIILAGPGRRVGVSLCNHKNMTSLAGRLKRLRSQMRQGGLDALFLVRHPWLSVSARAKKTRQYLEELQGQGTLLIQPDRDVMAALEALRGLLADAKAGDLSAQGGTVSPNTVLEWLRRALDGGLRDLAETIVGGREDPGRGDSALLQRFLSLLEDRKVISMEEAVRELDCEKDPILRMAGERPSLVGYLEGPPAVLFQYIPESYTWDD
ncbi:MAG: AAA family ATPase [Desulfobacteraceae bacterium]